jgi:hypothetical protein
MTIADGQAHARIDSAIFGAHPDMREELHNALNDRFLGVLLLTHRAYELSRSTMTRVNPGGRREIFCEPETGRFVISGSTVDFRVTDNEGSVIADSKRDRIEQKKSLGELIASHCSEDILLPLLLRSYQAALRDPNNELVHLYEIRDALSGRFGSDTRTALDISRPKWSRFGCLCNDEPLRQGRHRGRTGGALRDATEGELIEARDVARVMIEAYLQYLERQKRTGDSSV